jgi:hypothetical protein
LNLAVDAAADNSEVPSVFVGEHTNAVYTVFGLIVLLAGTPDLTEENSHLPRAADPGLLG